MQFGCFLGFLLDFVRVLTLVLLCHVFLVAGLLCWVDCLLAAVLTGYLLVCSVCCLGCLFVVVVFALSLGWLLPVTVLCVAGRSFLILC